MKKYGLVPERDYVHLMLSGKHDFYSCLTGDAYAQVHTPDLPEDMVYLIRKCNVCGTPFADGSSMCEPIDGFKSYVAESESKQKSLDHIHPEGFINHDNSKIYIPIYIQPNVFLRGYPSSSRRIVENKKEKELLWKSGERIDPIYLPAVGREFSSEGNQLLQEIYKKYYNFCRPIPIHLPELIVEEKGMDFYIGFVKAMENANKIGPRVRMSQKVDAVRKRINLAMNKEVLF